MTLKAVVDSIDAVPEAARPLYSEKDGKFHLVVEGLVSKGRLDEFRDTNLALKKQIEDLTSKFEGIDPDAARKLAIEAGKVRDKQLIEAGKVDELVAERTGTMKAEYEKLLKAERESAGALQRQLEGHVIDGALRDAATKAGVRATAVDDVLLRGRAAFRLVDGNAVAMDGDKPVFGKSGDPMPVSEWVSGLTASAPHLFEPSKGGDARGNSGGGAAAGVGQVARSDSKGFLANLQGIASGKVRVTA